MIETSEESGLAKLYSASSRPKTIVTNEAQDANTNYHSKYSRNTELAFQDWQDKDAQSRTDFRHTRGKAARGRS